MTTTLTRRNGRSTGGASAEPRVDRRVERRIGLPSGRAVIGGLLMALAAIGTFLAYVDAAADDTVGVLIASRDLAPGETIQAEDVQTVAVELPGEVRGLFGDVDAAVGRQLATHVSAGEFLSASATVVPVEGDERLEVSISLPVSRAVGRLRPGERVDVFSTWGSDVTELIAVDARVLEVSGADSAFGGGQTVTVRLALAEFSQVEALVHAQAVGDITMIRATFDTEVEDLGREYRPRRGTDPATGGG